MMLYVNTQILQNALQALPYAFAYISDARGFQVRRNGVYILRTSDANGNIILPALDTDFVTVTAKGFDTKIFPANKVPGTIELNEKQTLFNTFYGKVVITETLALLAVVVVAALVTNFIIQKTKS